MELAQKTQDKTFLASVYFYLSQLEEKKGNYKASLEYYKKNKKYVVSINDEREKANYMEVQKKYDFELMRNTNSKLLINNQKILISFLTAILSLIIIAFLFYRKNKKDEKAMLLVKQEIYQLKEIINKFTIKETEVVGNRKNNTEAYKKIMETLWAHFGIFKRIALLENSLSEKEKEKNSGLLKRIYTIVYGHSDRYDWKVLVDTLNDLYDGYANRLREIAPKLKEIEYRICCLSKSGLSNSEIGSLLNKSENAIELQKTNIRAVLNLQKQTNFVKELDKFINKS
jgi:DNA-binding CsgD family transcriptional regulator